MSQQLSNFGFRFPGKKEPKCSKVCLLKNFNYTFKTFYHPFYYSRRRINKFNEDVFFTSSFVTTAGPREQNPGKFLKFK